MDAFNPNLGGMLRISNNTVTAPNGGSNVFGTCYGTYTIAENSKKIHQWKFQILQGDKWGSRSIGIDEHQCKWIHKKFHEQAGTTHYSYNSYGKKTKCIVNALEYGQKYGEEYGAGDKIAMKFDCSVNPPTLSFTKNEKDFGVAFNVERKNYKLAVGLYGDYSTASSIRLVSYSESEVITHHDDIKQNENIMSLQQQIETLKRENVKTLQTNDRLEQQIANLRKEITRLNNEYDKLRLNGRAKIEQLKAQYDENLNKLKEKKRQENKNDEEYDEEICKSKFRNWLFNTVKLKQYLPNFEQNECNDVRMIEFLDADTLKNDIVIQNKMHCKLILKKVKQFKQLQMEFNGMLSNYKQLKMFQEMFEANGILRWKDLQNDIQTKQQLSKMLKVINENQLDELWAIIHTNIQDNSARTIPNNEGQKTVYIAK
eukprot:516666_1